MAVPVTVPSLGSEMAGGLVAEWYLPDGAPVGAGDALYRLECDFVAVEVEAEADGMLRHGVEGGAVCEPGAVVAYILGPGERLKREGDEESVEAVEPPEDEAVTNHAMLEPEAVATDSAVEPDDDQPVEESALPERPLTAYDIEPIPLRRRSRQGSDDGTTYTPFDQASIPDFSESGGLFAGADPDEPEPHPALITPLRSEEWRARSEDWPDGPSPEITIGRVAQPQEETPLEPEAVEEVAHTFGAWLDEAESHEAEEAAPEDSSLPVTTAAPALYMRATVNMTEAGKARTQLAASWQGEGPQPADEDLVLRAMARALGEQPPLSGMASAVGLCVTSEQATRIVVVRDAAKRRFREAVEERLAAREDEACECTLTPLGSFGVDEAAPRLRPGHRIAFTMGATRSTADSPPAMTMMLAYDPESVPEGAAARLISRVRELVEAPYALLAD